MQYFAGLLQLNIDRANLEAVVAGPSDPYLTSEWFTLRLPDNDKVERRTTTPLWCEVQGCASFLGPDKEINRCIRTDANASAEWYVAHIAGCLPAFAARENVADLREAILKLGMELLKKWQGRDFEAEFLKQSIKLGQLMGEQGDVHGID
jgi:hypothetical protein